LIDECDQVFGAIGPDGKLLGERFGVLAKRIRKLGMGFICASQYSGLQVFGNSELLRSNVATKNLVAFRTTSNTSGRLIPGLPVAPATLPRRAGYGVVAGEKTRTAPFRACFAPRRGKPLPPGVTPPAYADDVITLYPEPQVHPIDAAAIRGKLADPEIAAAQAQADAMRKLAAIMGGHSLPAQPVATASGGGGGTSNGTGGIPKVPAAVIPLPRHELDRAALGEVERAVLAAMSDGHTRTGDIVAAYGEDNPTNRRKIQSALNDLATAGWATKGGHGVWLLTDAARNRVA
jgi:hypothetical protein